MAIDRGEIVEVFEFSLIETEMAIGHCLVVTDGIGFSRSHSSFTAQRASFL